MTQGAGHHSVFCLAHPCFDETFPVTVSSLPICLRSLFSAAVSFDPTIFPLLCPAFICQRTWQEILIPLHKVTLQTSKYKYVEDAVMQMLFQMVFKSA